MKNSSKLLALGLVLFLGACSTEPGEKYDVNTQLAPDSEVAQALMKKINAAKLVSHIEENNAVKFDLATGDLMKGTGIVGKLYSMRSYNQFVLAIDGGGSKGYTLDEDTLYQQRNEGTIAEINWGTKDNNDRIYFAIAKK